MLKLLLSQFIKSNGRKPNNLEMILLRQKASKEAVNERKIVNMFDRQPVDANKPILGGKNIIETDEQMIQRFKKQNEDSINRLKNKKDPPEELAGGGVAGLLGERPGYKLGDIVKENIPPEYRLYLKSILPGGEEGKVDESYFTKKFKKELRLQALSKFLKTGKTKGIVTEGDQHRGDPTVNKLLKFPSTYASLGTYTYDIDPKTMDVKITDKYDWNPAYGSKSIRDKRFTGYIGDKKGTDVDLNMFKDFAVDSLKNKNIDKESLLEMTGNYFGGKQSEGKGFDVDIDIPMEEATTATEGSFAQGGPARQNFAMGKRAFLKMLGGVGAGIAGLKSGLLGFGGKQATKKAVTETVKQAAGSGGQVPPYFLKLVSKIKTLGDETVATKDKTNAYKYKDYTMEEDFAGNIEITKKGIMDEPDTPEVFMSLKVDEVPLKGKKGSTRVQEYEEFTGKRDYKGDLDVEPGVPDSVVMEVEAGSGNVPESFYTGPNAIKKADGGRIGYSAGSKVIGKGIMAGINKLFGKGTMTTADKIKRPQQALDREMFKKFETNNPKLSEIDEDILIRAKELKLEDKMPYVENLYRVHRKDEAGIGSLKEFHADFVKETGQNVPIENLRTAWRSKRSYPFNTPVVDKTGKSIGGEATQKMYPESKKFIVEESTESFMKPKKRTYADIKKEREFIDVPEMPKGFKLSREKLEQNYPELDEDMINQIMELDKDMQGTVLTMLKNRRKDPDAYDKLLETKGDTLEFQGAFDKVTRRKNNATGGLAGMLGE